MRLSLVSPQYPQSLIQHHAPQALATVHRPIPDLQQAGLRYELLDSAPTEAAVADPPQHASHLKVDLQKVFALLERVAAYDCDTLGIVISLIFAFWKQLSRSW